jgi:hypothetical protein
VPVIQESLISTSGTGVSSGDADSDGGKGGRDNGKDDPIRTKNNVREDDKKDVKKEKRKHNVKEIIKDDNQHDKKKRKHDKKNDKKDDKKEERKLKKKCGKKDDRDTNHKDRMTVENEFDVPVPLGVDSESSSDWSDDEGNVRSDAVSTWSKKATNMREIRFLPNGNVLLAAPTASSSNKDDKGWKVSRSGDAEMKQYGTYRLNVPVYSIFTGEIVPSNNEGNVQGGVRKAVSTAKSDRYISSFQLAQKAHTLPSDAIFRPIQRPDKYLIPSRNDYLSEIRGKKTGRYFIAGKYSSDYFQNNLNNERENRKGKGKGKEKKKGVFKKGYETLTGSLVKRIRYKNIKKEKERRRLELEPDHSIRDDSNALVLSSGPAVFLGSGFIPLPPISLSDIDSEFNFIEEVKREEKRSVASMMGFGTDDANTSVSSTVKSGKYEKVP